MDSVIILLFIIQVILIVVFIRMTFNVSKIRRLLESSGKDWYYEYNKNMYLGRRDKAANCIQEHVWVLMEKNRSNSNYEKLKSKYQSDFENLGIQFPLNPYKTVD
ncbi:hypothetical protein [Cecembia rubra]|uniref:Uncharacterized protein n=1 Tax=Cecembia rubra TaxID=1485585 RepID=A0A2P8E351_9BACT|nr:hypothetical protein [Cecembia rubra]PSL03890.1 hypothetical protein CLV48_106130 [Cecembia rubra]